MQNKTDEINSKTTKLDEVQNFIRRSLGSDLQPWSIDEQGANSQPVYIVTGASFTAYDKKIHGEFTTHSYSDYAACGSQYLLNNTASIAEKLLAQGHRVVLHVKDKAQAEHIFGDVDASQIHIIEGDLGNSQVVEDIYAGLSRFAQNAPISNIGLSLYQSFAQSGGMPFHPMHQEQIETIEAAANKRLRFVYNMVAMSYDMLLNRQVDDLRIVSLSALASNRATYGLIADAADKFMNELAWRTFYIEGRALTGKNISYFQVNPGITTACEVYKLPEIRDLVIDEAAADGFPFSSDVTSGKSQLPQISAEQVAWVSQRLLTAQVGDDLNKNLPPYIKRLLSGGRSYADLKSQFEAAVQCDDESLSINLNNELPEYIFSPASTYGALPKTIEKNMYRRITLTPPGQLF
jgi:NAD(P)-dependent dehydrogenase (short-subunit alcohol dehydrogenase family)